MKTLKIIAILIAFLGVNITMAQQNDAQKKSKYVQTTLQTNGVCQTCKDKIEGNIAYEKGVKDVVFDLATSKVTITYNPAKNTVVNLCKAVQKLGFTAEECLPVKSCSGTCEKGEKCKGDCAEHKATSENPVHCHFHCNGHH